MLFYDNQDTESESWEIEIGLAGPITTLEKYQIPHGKTISMPHKMGENIVVFIFMEL